jgi:hypothetical protein
MNHAREGTVRWDEKDRCAMHRDGLISKSSCSVLWLQAAESLHDRGKPKD